MAAQQPQQANDKIASEDIIARKTDLCISNAIVKTSAGFAVGVLASVILFRRRAFPLWLGTGFGAGSAYTDCERSFNPYSAPGLRILPNDSSSSSSSTASSALERLSQRAGEAVGAAKAQAKPKVEEAKKEVKDKTKQLEAKGQEAKDAVEKKIRQV